MKLLIRIAWIGLMAWRDARSSLGRFVLLAATISLGIAAMIATGSFRVNLRAALDDQAKSLLGADLVTSSRSPFSDAALDQFAEIPGQRLAMTTFASMVRSEDGTRLARVRAVAHGYPFYGQIVTTPEEATREIGAPGKALLAESLMLQLNVSAGEHVQLGRARLEVVGSIEEAPGETAMGTSFAPLVLVSQGDLALMDLIKKGSRVRYELAFRTPPHFDVGAWVARMDRELDQLQVQVETVEKRKRVLGRAFDNLYRFLGLAGLAALLLGAIGVATTVNVFIRQKIQTIALVRCLGASVAVTEAIFMVQAVGLGFLGALMGLGLGAIMVTFLPSALDQFLPLDIQASLAFNPTLSAMLWGIGLTFAFTSFPLARIRLVSPLAAFRTGFGTAEKDRLKPILVMLSLSAVAFFTADRLANVKLGLGVTLSIALALAMFMLGTRGLIFITRKVVRKSWAFHWRQGLANLYRPNNLSLMTIVAMGFSVFVVLTLMGVHFSMMGQLSKVNRNDRGNLLLFDIQDDQVEGIQETLRAEKAPVIESIPIVTMRLDSIRGTGVSQLDLPDWAAKWEYRSTYRSQLHGFEKVVEGSWVGEWNQEGEMVPVSLEKSIADTLKIELGDALVFNVQGVELEGRVASIREVQWQSMQPNFYVVFPTGVLEPAPKIHLVLTRTSDAEHASHLQRQIASVYPNVSVFDLRALIRTIDEISGKLATVLTFMTSFITLTGLLILCAAIYSTHAARTRENAIFKALGATRQIVVKTALSEFFWLAMFAAAIGCLTSSLAVWALARFVFEIELVLSVGWMVMVGIALLGVTQGVGFLSQLLSWRQTPLQALREEIG